MTSFFNQLDSDNYSFCLLVTALRFPIAGNTCEYLLLPSSFNNIEA